MQTDLQAQIQKASAQTETQLKQLKDGLESELKTVQQQAASNKK